MFLTGNNNKILIVDDTPENIKVLGTMLLSEGFKLNVARSGVEALKIMEKNIPDIILLDINMPEMDGFEVCHKIKMNPATEEIPVIFLTAYTDTQHKQEAFSVGGVDYITKPFQKKEVIARVTAHLEIARYRNSLKNEVKKRTLELEKTNQRLKEEIIKGKKIEEALAQAQKMEIIGTLAGGLAHDLNNMLGGITGPLSIIQSKLLKDENIDRKKLLEYSELMSDSSLRATDLVKQLLTLARKREFNLNHVNLNKSLTNVIKICENSFDRTINFNIEYSKKPAIIEADPTQIEQVLLNFCINASHAMTVMRENNEKWGGTLSISINKMIPDKHFCTLHPEAEIKEYHVVSIGDTGVGIDRETLSQIFIPFFTTKDEDVGTGLGLAMVYSIVKAHGGFITVYSKLNIGTDFNIYLPTFEEQDQSNKLKDIDESIFHKSGLILVVEDDEILRILAKDILEECGYDVIYAKNGKEGVIMFNEFHNKISAVLLDLVIPNISGKDAFLQMKEIDPEVKVLLSSGFRQTKRVKELLRLGVKGFVHKPYTLENLAEAIDHVISSE